MQAVHAAIKSGRCVVAVGAHLLRDPQVVLNLRDREGAVPSVALSGPIVAPVQAIGAEALARATGQAEGVVVLVEPEDADWAGIEAIEALLRSSPHKPSLVVIGRPPQQLKFTFLFRGIPVTTAKGRGLQFLQKLPKPDPQSLPQVSAPPAAKSVAAITDLPQQVFVGRDEELAELTGLFGQGGPIVISGPEGVGRHRLIDAAIQAAELARPLDVRLGRGAGFDTLVGRLAELTDGAGASALAEVLADPAAGPVAVTQAAISALQAADSLAGTALVVDPLEVAAGRELDFFRKDALSYLVQQLLANTYSLRLIFVAGGQPPAFDHESSQAVRRMVLDGIKGRFFHEIFDAVHAGDIPREKFGPLAERIHGHPMTVRTLALEVRDRDDGEDLVDKPKYLKTATIEDTKPLRKLIERRVRKLPDPLRAALARAAHLCWPATSVELNEIGVNRKERLALVQAGMLEDISGDDGRRYRVHPLVSGALRYREVADFDVLAQVGALYKRLGKDAEGVDRIAYAQEANRCFVAARRYREVISFRFPDDDPELEAITNMIRSKQPHFELARERVMELLGRRDGCSDAHLRKLELMRKVNAPREAIDRSCEAAMTLTPLPEVFHEVATLRTSRGDRAGAIEVLERGTQALPSEVRLQTRLAALLMREGRRPEALERLKSVMEQAPMLPDAYGLLGMARFDEGEAAIDDAEALLREAVRLAPGDPVQVPRLVLVLQARARVADEKAAETLRSEARELLADMTRDERKNPEGYLMLARLEIEVGNLDRAEWMLDQARKRTDRRHERNVRIRLEKALLQLKRGDLDAAERDARSLVDKAAGNHRVFVLLSQILEARGQLIPAHAELLRASERVAPTSLDGRWLASELTRLQTTIETQAAGLGAATAPAASATGAGAAAPVPTPHAAPRTTVRRRKAGTEAEGEAAGAGADAGGADAGAADSAGADADADAAVAAGAGADSADADADVEGASPGSAIATDGAASPDGAPASDGTDDPSDESSRSTTPAVSEAADGPTGA